MHLPAGLQAAPWAARLGANPALFDFRPAKVVIGARPMTALNSLVDGYRRFRSAHWLIQRRRWEALAQGQSPPVMIVGCCDSRVDPATIFDAGPGELFITRNVANLVPPYQAAGGRLGASAAIEYAVTELKVSELLVLGHGACGGIRASLAERDLGAPGYTFIDAWLSMLDEARDQVKARAAQDPSLDPQRELELESIKVSLANLRTFPFVKEAEQAGALKLRGAYFAIADGVLHLLDEARGSFEPVG
jgi:carbonic anhydrase